MAEAAAHPDDNSRYLLKDARLIYAAEKESARFALGLREFYMAADSSGNETQRVRLLAREYLTRTGNCFDEETLAPFVEGFQRLHTLDMGELWGLKPALQMDIIERLTSSQTNEWPPLLLSLCKIGETSWKDLFEAISVVHGILSRDPAGAYLPMDFESRDRYRNVIGEMARHSRRSEPEVAENAIALCRKAAEVSDGSRAMVRRTHAGYYLVDHGRAQLEAEIGYRAPLRSRFSRLVTRHPSVFYLAGIELLTLSIVFGVLLALDSIHPAFAVLILLLLPATQAAADFVNNLVTVLVSPRILPKLDFSENIPDDCATLVAVPTLLLNESQVHDLVLDLEIRFLANRSPNLYFALLTDSPDSDQRVDERDAMVAVCRQMIEGLNRRYPEGGRAPFFLLHRHRAYNHSEGRWMGWERKRGKLLDLNQMLRGGFDAFPVKVGDMAALANVRYVIALDSDTQLPRDSAAKLIGAIAHPLNQAVIHPGSGVVVEGYGILQPRIGVGIQSASRSRLASLYSGQTGFDIYTRAVSDVYQDLFGEGIFTGKGIYEVDTLREVLEHRFPENALLSHDLIEGTYARTALVTDIELVDDYPSHFSAYSRRKHRWVRGDWQILRWLGSRVRDSYGRTVGNPITLISQWKILDNLRRSLLEPSLLLLLLGGWLYLPGSAFWWTALAMAMLFIPVFSGLLFAVMRAPREWRAVGTWMREVVRSFLEGIAITVCTLIFLLHQALISLDAVVRSIGRVFVTRRKLLEWEVAAEAESAERPKATVDIYLEWTPWIAIALGFLIGWVRPEALPAAAPILLVWAASRIFSSWLNRRPRAADCRVSEDGSQLLRDSAERIWRFFHDWSSPSTNWLIPDSVREDGRVDLRVSPTNLGLLLNSRIAAVHLGLLRLEEFAFATRQTLDRVTAMRKYRGHLFNWYDIASLKPLAPEFVSTVDSGNLAASLWTLKQAALAFAGEPQGKRGLTAGLSAELQQIAEVCDALVREMDFGFLFNPRKKVLSVGYCVASGLMERSTYNLLASESRIATFVAIAKGDIPQECWFHLGRAHTLVGGERVLLSWTGTMFEYLMPALWMRSYPDTIMDQTIRAVVRVQREYGRRKGVPWGISEAVCLGRTEDEWGYAPFGIPTLAMESSHAKSLVISPYSSFLATCVEPAWAADNLRRMQEFGWLGRYGFYESIDYSQAGGEAMRMWMPHHQGMSLLAIVNLLFDGTFQQYFHAEPQALATELLLHERLPASALVEAEAIIVPEALPQAAEA